MDAAPKEVLQHVGKQTSDLHNAVASESTRAGHPVTAAGVNPEDHTPLNNIREIFGDAAHVVGSSVEEHVAGASDTTHVRTTGGKGPIVIAARRLVEKARKLRRAA